MPSFFSKKLFPRGIVLIEASLALAVLAIFVAAIGTNLFQGIASVNDSGERGKALALAEEGLEVARNARDGGLCCQTSGTFYVQLKNNRWNLSTSTSDTTDIFNRVLQIDAQTTSTFITSSVTWQHAIRGPLTVSLTTRLTSWKGSSRGGLLVYSDRSVSADTIKYRTWNNNTWGAEQTVPSFNVPLNRQVHALKLYSSPNSLEKVLIAKYVFNGSGDDQYIYAAVWNGTGWGSVTKLASWPGTTNQAVLDFDGTYTADGHFMTVYDDNTNIPKYAIWDGLSWSTGNTTLDIGGNPEWIKIKNRPKTSEVLAIIHDAGNDTNTLYWNGTSWGSLVEHGVSSVGSVYDDVSVDWSTLNQTTAAILYNPTADNLPNIRIWNGLAWGASTENINLGAQTRAMNLENQPGTNNFLMCAKDSANDISCLTSDITPAWSLTSPTKIATNTDAGNQRTFDIGFASVSTHKALVVYSNGTTTADQALPKYRVFSANTKTFSNEQSLGDLGGAGALLESVRVIPDPKTDTVIVLLGSSAQTLWTAIWDAATDSFLTGTGKGLTLQSSFGSADNDYWFDFAWNP